MNRILDLERGLSRPLSKRAVYAFAAMLAPVTSIAATARVTPAEPVRPRVALQTASDDSGMCGGAAQYRKWRKGAARQVSSLRIRAARASAERPEACMAGSAHAAGRTQGGVVAGRAAAAGPESRSYAQPARGRRREASRLMPGATLRNGMVSALSSVTWLGSS